jgi:hypothetical protein
MITVIHDLREMINATPDIIHMCRPAIGCNNNLIQYIIHILQEVGGERERKVSA